MQKKSTENPFQIMQMAVDVVHDSQHPTSKVAAAISGTDQSGALYQIATTNYWPKALLEHFDSGARIGNSSGTIHAETEAILKAPCTQGAALFITDPFCPNCAKNMAEAGIKEIYIDHKGFNKDFAERRGHHFDNMSMQICEKAGIDVYEIWRKEKKLIPILKCPDNYIPHEDNPVTLEEFDKDSFTNFIKHKTEQYQTQFFAVALTHNNQGQVFALSALQHVAVGYSQSNDNTKSQHGKYTFFQNPINRLLMNAARHGLTIEDGAVYSSCVPTSREQVNLVGAGITNYIIGDKAKARDEGALTALKQLSDAKIIKTSVTS